MTIFRFSAAVFASVAALAIFAGCQRTMTMSEILASDLEQEHLSWQFGERLDFLSENKDLMRSEMKASGFELKERGEGCGAWELPQNPKRVRAFVQYCENKDDSVAYTRFGISRSGMTYD